MMKILIFDLTKTQPIGDVKAHGGGKYGEIVFKALLKKTNNIIAYYNKETWLNPEIEEICKANGLIVIDSSQRSLPEIVKEYGAIVYSPIVGSMEEMADGITYITTIHGLRHLELRTDKYTTYFKNSFLRPAYNMYYKWKGNKEFISTLNWYREVFRKKNVHIVTVSEHSKSSILSFAPFLKSKDVKVFYSPSTFNEKYGVVEPYSTDKYYLIVSANRWIKNAFRGLLAFDELFTERPDFVGKVIVAGASNKHVFTKHLKNKERFVFIDYVEEETLFALYKGTYLFVYPSLNEGFGYPPIEAMTQGAPIIAAAISSIPEVCENGVLYFNPLMVSEIKMRILQMENEEIRQVYQKKAIQRVREVQIKQDVDLGGLTDYILSFT